jgi:murein DD-endopeptidase MepM/ murein hydrolase activator NlpD
VLRVRGAHAVKVPTPKSEVDRAPSAQAAFPRIPFADPLGQAVVSTHKSGTHRRLVLTALAALTFFGGLFLVGRWALVLFGPFLALSTSDEDAGADVAGRSRLNLGLAAATTAAFAWFVLRYQDLSESTVVVLAGALIAVPLALQPAAGTAGLRRVAVTKRSLILAVWGLVVFVVLWQDRGVWFLGMAAVCVVLPLALGASRMLAARRGRVEFGLLRHPLHRSSRGHLLQAMNVWLAVALLGGVLAVGGTHHARIVFSLTAAQFAVLTTVFVAGLVLLAALAVVPRRRVHAATNVVVALLSAFVAVQLVQVSVPPTGATVLDSPLAGQWFVYNAGRSVLLNGHNPNERHAVDFMRLGANGRTHAGGGDASLARYAGFGMPVLSPADGRVVEVTDRYPDNQPGTNSDFANHLVLDIGHGRFVSMAHLMQASVKVRVGDDVRRGQPLAAVGNNGHSSQPHLHLQVQDSPASMDAERTYPMVFRNVDVTRGGPWPGGLSGELRTGDLVAANT